MVVGIDVYIKCLLVCFVVMSLGNALIAAVGYLISRSKKHYRFGIRLLKESVFSYWIIPKACRSRCDGSCPNWDCANYRPQAGKFETGEEY